MSERPSTQTGAERAEAAATRRRWVTLAEVVAVAGVLIAALTLWSNWSERRADEQAKVAAETSEARDRSRVDLEASVADGGRTLTVKDARHDLSDMTVAFPKALGVPVQQPVDTQIDSAWFSDALLKATDGGADDRTGRLPVLVTVRYLDGDVARTARGIYDVIWRTEGRLLRGRAVRLEAMRLRSRGGTVAALDPLWARAAK